MNINNASFSSSSLSLSLLPSLLKSLLSKSTPSTTHGPHLPSLFSSFVNYYTKNPDAHLILDHEEQIRNSLGGDVNGGDGRILISPTYALGKLAQFIHIEMDETKLLQIPLLTVEAYRGDRGKTKKGGGGGASVWLPGAVC